MFKPNQDRIDYSSKLEPPIGYETVYGIGTTYSMDLDTLLGISIALGLSESVDNELSKDPLYILEALRRVSDKVLVFCEGGQIQAPEKRNELYSLLEKMVFEVTMKNRASFHPKFWLIKYQDEEKNPLYRLMVLSRNLTFDRSWDFAVTMEGYTSEKADERNRPISDFLRYLRKSVKRGTGNKDQRALLNRISKEIEKVSFRRDSRFYDHSFHPVGIPDYPIEKTDLFAKYHELFIISPFISRFTIEKFKNKALIRPDRTLITRKSEVPLLKQEDLEDFSVYSLKDLIVDGEDAISEDTDVSEGGLQRKQDIHAKVYLKTRGANTDLFIGSLNASKQACEKNVEFLLKLRTKRGQLSVKNLKDELFGSDEKDSPFEQVTEIPETEEKEEKEEDAERIIKDIVALKSTAECRHEEDGYGIHLEFRILQLSGKRVFIRPLLGIDDKELVEKVSFKRLRLDQVSMFFVVTVATETSKVKRVLKIFVENIPEERDRSIVNRIIDSKERFIQYVTFMLGEDYFLSFLEYKTFNTNRMIFGMRESVPAIYEKMLRTVSRNPEKLNDIQKLIEMISDEQLIPEGFVELYNEFQKVVEKS